MDIPYEKMSNIEDPTSSDVYTKDSTHIQETPGRIRHYFVFSLFSAICLCPATGLIALAYSLKSSAKADVKFHDKAKLYSRRALLWNLLSVIFAASVIFLFVACSYYLNTFVAPYPNGNYDTFQGQPTQDINNNIN